MNFIIHLLLTYAAIPIIRTAPPPNQHVYFQIDEFINQLMTSEKFDELADLIAEKAAHKIKSLDLTASEKNKDSVRHRDMALNKNINSKETINREEQTNDDPDNRKERDRKTSDKSKNYDRDRSRGKESRSNEKLSYDRKRKRDKSRSAERSNHAREKHSEKGNKSKEKTNLNRDHSETRQKNDNNHKGIHFGKIDTQSFLKNHMSSKELELNFKHLTEELEKHRFNIKQNPNTDNDNDKEKKRREHNKNTRSVEQLETEPDSHENVRVQKNEGNNEKKIDSKELRITDLSSNENKEAHEQDNFHETDKDSRENKPTNESDGLNEDRRHAEPKYNAHALNEKSNPPIQQQNQETEDISKSFEGKTSLEKENKDKSPDKKRPVDLKYSAKEVGVYRARNDETSKAISEDNLSVSQGIPIVNSIIIDKLPVREENGKLFTFETSPDYADYHDSVAKQNQQKYINTYKKKK